MLELLTAFVILANPPYEDVKLNVSCDEVSIDYGGVPRATKMVVTFWMNHGKTPWRYSIPMEINNVGNVVLDSATFWLEEIKTQKVLIVQFHKATYQFDLTGTYNKVNCD